MHGHASDYPHRCLIYVIAVSSASAALVSFMIGKIKSFQRIEMTEKYRNWMMIGALLCSSAIALAHGDTDEPLFVASAGSDIGDCKDRSNPCQSISYALKRAGKGGQIRVSAGTYEIENAEDLFHIVSGTIDVFGGFLFENDFRPTLQHVSTLTNVPAQFRTQLERHGFQVIADSKGAERQINLRTEKLLALDTRLQSNMTAAPCTGGTVNGLNCDSVDLLSHMAFGDISDSPNAAADVWGFVDLNTKREYAIIGLDSGTAIIDISNAEIPVEVDFVPGQTATWRDIKVYQIFDQNEARWKAYAYVTTDGASDGLFVIDLSGLPHSVNRINYSSDFSSAHNVYATRTDFSTGISQTGDTPALIIAGSNIDSGQYRAYSLENPESPQYIGNANGAGYMHDASSMIVTDARKDTQCAAGGAYCEVLLDFNENEIEIWDITDIASPSLLSATTYANVAYVHSGWWSEDKQYLFVHDELDEQRFGLQTTLRVFSVADLTNPVEVGAWAGSTTAIDHNGFVRGNRYYMSNYSRGLTVLDISNPVTPVAVGNLDTYPFSDTSSFVGAWGAYPYFYSGNIAISDISSGFYLAEDHSRDVPQGSLSYVRTSYGVTEGDQATLEVSRNGGSTGIVAVDYEVLAATASTDDFTVLTGQLTWNSGDTTTKQINISAFNDGVSEPLEHLIVRLVAPTGGATLGNDSTSNLFISDPSAISTVQFFVSSIDVTEQGFATAVITARRDGSAIGAVSVDFDLVDASAESGVDYQGNVSGTFSWADGDAEPRNIEFAVVDDGSTENTEFFELELSNAVGATIGTNGTVRVNISDEAATPPPPPPRNKSGGGAITWIAIPLLLMPLVSRRRKISRRGVS
jgi:choice-of-anchor B domain-containing protein